MISTFLELQFLNKNNLGVLIKPLPYFTAMGMEALRNSQWPSAIQAGAAQLGSEQANGTTFRPRSGGLSTWLTYTYCCKHISCHFNLDNQFRTIAE